MSVPLKAPSGLCEDCRAPVSPQFIRCWGCYHLFLGKAGLPCRDDRCPFHGKAPTPEDDLTQAARDLVRWHDHAGCDEPEMLQARVEVLRRALAAKGHGTPAVRPLSCLEIAMEVLGASRKAHAVVSLTPAQAEAVVKRISELEDGHPPSTETLEAEVGRLSDALEAADARAVRLEGKVAEGEAEVKRLEAVGARLAMAAEEAEAARKATDARALDLARRLEESEAAYRVAARTARELEEHATLESAAEAQRARPSMAAVIRRAEVAERTLDDVTHSRDAALKLAESRFDCHAGPGTATMGCGACISCLTNRLIAAEADAGQLRVDREGHLRDIDGLRRANAGLNDKLRAAEQARDEVKSRVSALDNALTQANAVLDAVTDALEGKPVSDFMESFPLVMRAGEVRRSADAWEQAYREVTATIPPGLGSAKGKIGGGLTATGRYCLMVEFDERPPSLRMGERVEVRWLGSGE